MNINMDKTVNLLSAISEKMEHCSKSQKKIGAYLLENYAAASYMTAAKLSETVGVSESTIVRYATELGFEGYPELQSALRYLSRSKLTSVQRMEHSLSRIGENALKTSFGSDLESIKKTLANTDIAVFDAFVSEIINAKRIYIVGARSSAGLALFLNYYLSILFDNVRLVQASAGGDVFEQLFRVHEGDAVIGITFPRYSRLTLDALNFSKRSGAKILGITDSIHSPLANISDITLFADNESDAFVDSLAAPLVLVNAILTEIGRRDPKRTAERFAVLEQIWAENEVY